ncbi:hypothetical protein ACJRO7_009660 [Eucalyptus globulus]|uniref:Pentatricopeptide repeat-containing protein n=1 Tax=Eucalyptus globulus TaxID=34317 RepID=A0ABD3LCY5_EUCGL
MRCATLPKHVAAVFRYQKRMPSKRSSCSIQFHGEFEVKEYLLAEIRTNINATYRKESILRVDFYNCKRSVQSCNMRDKGISPDVYTYTIRIKSFFQTESSPNLFMFIIFIQGICRKGAFVDAVKLLESVTTLIGGLCKNSRSVEAKSFMSKMVNFELELDDYRYNPIINGPCKVVFKRLVSDQFSHFSLISGLCQDGDGSQALTLFNEVSRRGVKSNAVLYNTVIRGLSQKGLIIEVMELMTEMFENGFINGLCEMGSVSDAYDAITRGWIVQLERMCSYRIFPDVTTYNSMSNGLCNNASKSENVMETFDAMVGKQCIPIITHNIPFESLCKARKVKEAMNLLDKMEVKGNYTRYYELSHWLMGFVIMRSCSHLPNIYTCCVMIDGCSKAGDADFGCSLLLGKIENVRNCLSVKHRVHEALWSFTLWFKGIVPKVGVTAPKIVQEDLLKRIGITCYVYELLHESVQDKKMLKKMLT